MVKKIFDDNHKDKAILTKLTNQGTLPDIKNSFNVLDDVIGKIKKNKLESKDLPDLSLFENVTAYFRLLRNFIELKKSKKRSARKTYLTTFFTGLEYIAQNKVYHPFSTFEICSIGKLVQAQSTTNFVDKLNFWKENYPYIGRAIDLVDDRFTGFIDNLAGSGASRDIAQGKVMLNLLNRVSNLNDLLDSCPDRYAKWEECIQTGRILISPDAKNHIPEGEGNITVYKIAAMIEEICEQKKTMVRVETIDEMNDRIELQTGGTAEAPETGETGETGETEGIDQPLESTDTPDEDLLDLPADTEQGVILTTATNISDTKKVFIPAVQKETYQSISDDAFAEMTYDEKITTGIKLLELTLGDHEMVEQLKAQYLA